VSARRQTVTLGPCGVALLDALCYYVRAHGNVRVEARRVAMILQATVHDKRTPPLPVRVDVDGGGLFEAIDTGRVLQSLRDALERVEED
jgi:hypothetical protein